MTTDHNEMLDAALIRLGRADVDTELDLVGANTARWLFDRFFPAEDALSAQFEAQLGTTRSSPAEIQGRLLANCSDPSSAALAVGLRPTLKGMAAE